MKKFERLSDHLYRFEDTCNVYVLTDGDTALLIDAGSGAVIDHLGELGISRVEWVLQTHHHRDQCWGDAKLIDGGAAIAVPQHERHLFEQAELFWQTRRTFDNYNDRNTFFTIGKDIPVQAALNDYEYFEWRGTRFFVLPAKGHTLGSVALLAEVDGRLIAFTGDLMGRGGVLYQLHAMEYNYGDMIGALFTLESIQVLRDCLTGEIIAGQKFTDGSSDTPPLLLPSHGETIDDPIGDINRLERNLTELAALGRGMRMAGRESIPEPLFLPEPKFIQLSDHLLWGGEWTCSFFYVLLSDSGKAMFIDYGHGFRAHMHTFSDHDGLESMRFIEHHLKQLRRDFGVEAFDLVVPTHIHDDHTCGIPHLQRHYGIRCYALEQVAQVLEDPAAWASTPCTFPVPIRVDRKLKDGDLFEWEEYTFDIHFAPGQTEYHSVLVSQIDGRRVAFTGDNYFMHEVMSGGQIQMKPYQTTVLRNSFQLDMHRRCADVMQKVAPELICPGHNGIYECDKKSLDTYADFIQRKERLFRNLVADPADQHIDLFWVRMLPYVSQVKAGQNAHYKLLLRNNLERQATFEARLLAPSGWTAAGEFSSLKLEAGARGQLSLEATAPDDADGTRRLITAELCIDGNSQGPVAEALITVVP